MQIKELTQGRSQDNHLTISFISKLPTRFKNAPTKAENLLDDISFFGDSDLSLFFKKLLNGDCGEEMKDK